MKILFGGPPAKALLGRKAVLRAKRKLQLSLLIFSLALATCLITLYGYVQSRLQNDERLRLKAQAEFLAQKLSSPFLEVVRREEERRFIDYSFYTVESSTLLAADTITFSPLSRLNPESAPPGLVGYFEIEPNGDVTSPVLPPLIGKNEIDNKVLSLDSRELNTRVDYLARVKEKLPEDRRALLDQVRIANSTKPTKLRPESALVPNVQNSQFQQLDIEQRALNSKNIISGDPVVLNNTNQSRRVANFDLQGRSAKVGSLFQLSSAPGFLTLARSATVENGQVVQGFIVEAQKFLSSLSEPVIAEAKLQGLTILISSLARVGADNEILFTELPSPLSDFKVSIIADSLAKAKPWSPVDFVFIALVLVAGLGTLSIALISGEQIKLAAQQSNFAAAVTHELKTPLTSIRLSADMLRAGMISDEEKRKTYYERINSECERLTNLISNVLAISDLSTTSSHELSEQDPQLILNKVAAQFRPLVEKAGFILKTSSECPEPIKGSVVRLNEDSALQIFGSLIDNAIKFSSSAEIKTIELGFGLEQENGGRSALYFSVRDYGPGIPGDELKKIFLPFYRAEDELTRKTKGTGIGLAVARELAEKMGSSIRVRNVGPGAEFMLVFAESAD